MLGPPAYRKVFILNKTSPSQDSNDHIDQAYESLLEKALSKSKQTGTGIHQILDGLKSDLQSFSHLTVEETNKLEQSIKRDLIDAVHHLKTNGQELKDWLGFDLALIRNDLWQKFTSVADKTTLAILKLKDVAANAEYHTGEIIGLGTLVCDQCKAFLHFHKPGHIPPCPKCNGSHFHRLGHEL
jgi:hypothetical protein